MLEAGLYRPVLGHFTLFLKNKSTCQNHITLVSVITKLGNHSKQVLHITLSQKHELSSPQTPLNIKTPKICKTGKLLQLHLHLTNHSRVLSQTSSNTLHTTNTFFSIHNYLPRIHHKTVTNPSYIAQCLTIP